MRACVSGVRRRGPPSARVDIFKVESDMHGEEGEEGGEIAARIKKVVKMYHAVPAPRRTRTLLILKREMPIFPV